MENKQKNLSNIAFLRVITTLLVILGHSTYVYTQQWFFKTSVQSDFFNILTKYIYSFHMPLFIVISGYLYYYLRKENNKYNNFKKFTISKFKRLGIPYIIIATFYLIPILVLIGYYKKDSVTAKMSLLKIIIKNYILVLSPEYLWFIFVLFFVFIIFYLIEKFLSKNNNIINIVILLAINIVSSKLPHYFLINLIIAYLFYFYIGYLIRKHDDIIYKIINVKYSLIYIFIIQLIVFYISIKINSNILQHVIAPVLGIIGILLSFTFTYSFNNVVQKCTNAKIFKIIDKDSYPTIVEKIS